MRRPKPGEDDLEEMMKEFEAQKLIPSASVVNVKKREKDKGEVAGKKASIFSQKRLNKNENEIKKKFHIPEKECPQESESDVLTDIIEKNVTGDVNVTEPCLPHENAVSKHFPDVIKLVDINSFQDSKDNKKSLFAKQFQRMKADIQSNVSGEKVSHVNHSSFGNSSRILTGSGLGSSGNDVASLHEENLQTLRTMTEEEILEEKEKLVKAMDPTLLNFLKNRKKSSAVSVQPEVVPKPSAPAHAAVAKDEESDCVAGVTPGQYPGMERVETEKLEWQGELPAIKHGQLAGLGARFGFDGSLLSPDSEVPVTAGLHHHGQDQEHPGYTVEEMMILCRSINPRQRQLGLELVEAVLGRWWTGELDQCLEQNLVQEVVKAGLVQVIRMSLDSSEAGLVVAGLRTLVALLCCKEEERLLDWLVDIRQPVLAPLLHLGEDEERKEVADLTDHQLVMQDVLLGLVRMDLLARLHYVLTVMKLKESVMVTGVLGLLVRMARHSSDVAQLVSSQPLLSYLAEHHCDHPLYVKLIRLLCSWSPRLAGELVTRLGLEAELCRLIAGPGDSLYTTQLSVESHRLWAVLLSHGLVTSVWSSLYSIIMERLVKLYNTNQILHPSSVAAWLVLISGLMMESGVEVVGDLGEILENCLTKWLTQLCDYKDKVNPTFAQLVSVTCMTLSQYYSDRPDLGQKFADSVLERFLSSRQYKDCTARLTSSSPFLTSRMLTTRHPDCLPAVGVILHGGHPHPLLTPYSPDILLSGVLHLSHSLQVSVDESSVETVSTFLSLVSSAQLSLTSHWVSRLSSLLLHSLLSLYSAAGHLPSALSLATAFSISTLIQPRDKILLQSLFSRFLFNSSVFTKLPPPVAVTPLLTPSGRSPSAASIITARLSQLSSLQSLYTSLLTPEFSSTLQSNLLPLDWPYFPLISLYNSGQSRDQSLSLSSEDLVSVLSWISLLPSKFSPTARLVRLVTTLLCPGSEFLVPEISSLLHYLLLSILSSPDTLNLVQQVPGVTSNTDLYHQLVDQFISESYGDRVFSFFLVVPCTMDQPLAFR